MSEADRNGQIRLEIDQEVFIESVERGHRVEDANVATEVTSFERVGDAYVLEGAIVFAGFLTKDAGSDAAYAGQGASNRHVHHRMPFTLRVPVQHQPRGVVNVASRISDWQLDVLGEGWVQVQAQLRVTGLNGKHGYHFQCGAQEDGDVLFGNATPTRPEVVEQETDEGTAETAPSSTTPPSADQAEQVSEQDVELVSQGSWRATEENESNPVAEATSKLSEARGGAAENQEVTESAVAQTEASDTEHRESESSHSPESPSVREELLRLDKHVQAGDSANLSAEKGKAAESSSARSAKVVKDESGQDESVQAVESVQDAVENDAKPSTTEFEFEHQVDPRKQGQHEDVAEYSEVARAEQAVEPEQDESFVPSRSFSEDGFLATAGFVPTVRVGAQEPAEVTDGVEDENSDEERALPTVDTTLWSFVDFNAPENHYTLRYVIVMDEESIASVAERVGCSESELMRANRVATEAVLPGQVLKVPVVRTAQS